jgi:hypothetical protein
MNLRLSLINHSTCPSELFQTTNYLSHTLGDPRDEGDIHKGKDGAIRGIPFSAFWLRSSVVSVLISLISDTRLIESHDINQNFLGCGFIRQLAVRIRKHCRGIALFLWLVQPSPQGDPSNLEIGINSVNLSSLEIGGLYGSTYAVYLAREYSMITIITPSNSSPILKFRRWLSYLGTVFLTYFGTITDILVQD